MATRQELTHQFVSMREEKEVLNQSLKDLNKRLEEVEKQLVVCMENENLTSFREKMIGTVFLSETVHATVEDFEACYAWLKENNQEDIVKQTIHARTLAATVKDHGEIPGVKAHYQTKIGIRREAI